MESVFLLAQTVIAAPSARTGLCRIRRSDHGAARSDDIVALPDHGYNRPFGTPSNERLEERFTLVFSVVLLKVGLAWQAQLHRD